MNPILPEISTIKPAIRAARRERLLAFWRRWFIVEVDSWTGSRKLVWDGATRSAWRGTRRAAFELADRLNQRNGTEHGRPRRGYLVVEMSEP